MRKAAMAAALVLAFSSAAVGAEKSYQVTGPILELRDDVVVVQKGKEKWEIAKDPQTKVSGDLKVGSKATIQYTMKAKSIDVKGEAKKK